MRRPSCAVRSTIGRPSRARADRLVPCERGHCRARASTLDTTASGRAEPTAEALDRCKHQPPGAGLYGCERERRRVVRSIGFGSEPVQRAMIDGVHDYVLIAFGIDADRKKHARREIGALHRRASVDTTTRFAARSLGATASRDSCSRRTITRKRNRARFAEAPRSHLASSERGNSRNYNEVSQARCSSATVANRSAIDAAVARRATAWRRASARQDSGLGSPRSPPRNTKAARPSV